MSKDNSVRITYVVNHGWDPPRVGVKTKLLGGDIEVVAAGDLSKRLDNAEALLREVLGAAEHELTHLEENIRDFLNE